MSETSPTCSECGSPLDVGVLASGCPQCGKPDSGCGKPEPGPQIRTDGPPLGLSMSGAREQWSAQEQTLRWRRFHDQTRFGGPDAPLHERGNCFAAVMASLLGLPLDSRWEPIAGAGEDADDFWRIASEVIAPLGYSIAPVYLSMLTNGTLCEAYGKSHRGDWLHSVVWRVGRGLVHDPHPSRMGLAEEPSEGTVLVPFDPLHPVGEMQAARLRR